MANIDFVTFATRAEALTEFARTLGEHPPREPVPAWWDEFESWFLSKQLDSSNRDDEGRIRLMVRMEPFSHDEGPSLSEVAASREAMEEELAAATAERAAQEFDPDRDL